MPVRTDEVGTFLLSWTIEDVVAGSWSVTCRIEARDASAQAMTSATADFILMMPAEWSTSTVLFETTGQPSTMFGMNVSMVPV